MHILQISLDEHIFDESTGVADRMRKFAKKIGNIFIIIPSKKYNTFSLGAGVVVAGTGGKSKIEMFFKVIKIALLENKNKHFDCITAQDPFFTALAGYIISKKIKTPLHIQLHGDFFAGNVGIIKLFLAQFLCKRVAGIRVVRQGIKNDLMRVGIDASKITVVPIFVDIKKFANNNAAEISQKNKTIFLYLGRIEKGKNIEILISTIKILVGQQMRGFKLNIVGDGSEKIKLVEQIKKEKLQDFVEFFPYSKTPEVFYSSSDCFLFPSLSEGFGMAPLEALAAGCSLITTSVGWVDSIACGEPGIICVQKPNNANEWAVLMENYIKNIKLDRNVCVASAQKLFPFSEDALLNMQQKSIILAISSKN